MATVISDIRERFRRRLRQAREKRGRSVIECAHAAGVTPDTWYKWERGDRAPDSLELLDSAARAVGKSASQLLR